MAAPRKPVEFRDARLVHLNRSQRKNRAVPVRRFLVQQGTQRNPVPGPLSELVRRHDATGLDLYLSLLARATAPVDSLHGPGSYAVTMHNAGWARVAGIQSPSAVAKAWARLEDEHQLINRRRSGRMVDVVALNESGDGSPYDRPRDGGTTDAYLQLSFDYWLSGPNGEKGPAWIDVLTAPAKAMLLIGLTLREDFELPLERAPKWYGISADTALRGFNELRQHGLLDSRLEVVDAPLSPEGITRISRYTLLAPFESRKRKKIPLRKVS